MLEEGPVPLQRPLQLRRLVQRAEPAPGDQVGARCDGSRRVDLQQRQLPHHGQQIGRPRGGQQLGPDGDPSCLRAIELVHTHAVDHIGDPRQGVGDRPHERHHLPGSRREEAPSVRGTAVHGYRGAGRFGGMTISLDGRRFAAVTDVVAGEVGTETVFAYHERAGEVWAEYAGGSIRRGRLVGTRDGDRLDFRYVQLNLDGQTSSGHCVSEVSVLADGRVRLRETWSWESRPGSGSSVVEELPLP
ncbi:hypothetical protein GCM10027614_72340 [Micromonospora vulcania]